MACTIRSISPDELNKMMSDDEKRKAGILTALYNIQRKNRPFALIKAHSERGLMPMLKREVNAFRMWLSIPRKINGEFNNWNNGFLGSIWCDTELFGKKVRVAMYLPKPDDDVACKFMIMWDYFD
jgi:hypothetical protein